MTFRHTPYHMLIEAFGAAGCPLCAIADAEVMHYLDMLIHEHVNDLDFRDQLREAGGFCNTHSWWLKTRVQGAALGSTIMYRDVLNALRERVGRAAASSGPLYPVARRRRLFGGGEPDARRGCPACEVRGRIEATFVSTLESHLQDERFLDQYGASAGICVVHLEALLEHASSRSTLQRFLAIHRRILDRLIAELDEFQRKSDYRYQGETFGLESDAWQRAIELASGREGMR